MSDSISTADTAPATLAIAVTPDDAQQLPFVCKGLYIGTGGSVTVRPVHGDGPVTYRNLPDASYIGLRVTHVMASGTTAADIVAEG